MASDVANIIAALTAASECAQLRVRIEDHERMALLAACEKLRVEFESPLEAAQRIMIGAHNVSAVRIGMGMGLFNAMAAAKGLQKTATQLGKETGADPLLIVRIMRILTSLDMFQEVGVHAYKSRPLAATFADCSPLADLTKQLGRYAIIITKLVDYLASTSYCQPTSAFAGPFQYAMETHLHYFDWLATQPAELATFNAVMRLSARRGADWFTFYPVTTKLQPPTTITNYSLAASPFLVDIGGGTGHDLRAFRAAHPDIQGRLILEDLPSVISCIGTTAPHLPPSIEAISHDFFEPQPIRGARIYFLRTILHDWPDAQANTILRHIRDVMTTDSVVLLVENVLPDEKVSLRAAMVDLTMMAVYAAQERTRAQWEMLLEGAGLRLVKVWREGGEGGGEAVLEAAVA